MDVQSIHAACNRARARSGLAPLQLDAGKTAESQAWADHMAQTGAFHHGGGEEIIATASYEMTDTELIDLWLSSPGHRAWILSAAATLAGWGVASSGRNWYWSGSFDGMPGPAPGPIGNKPDNGRRKWWQVLLGWISCLLFAASAFGQPTVVVIYSHRDASHKAAIEAHLSPLVRAEQIRIWSDVRIRPGADWGESVRAAIDSADVVLPLISSDFVASDFCWRELERAFRRQADGLVVLPVVIRPVYGLDRLAVGKLDSVVLLDSSDSERSRVAAALDSLLPRKVGER